MPGGRGARKKAATNPAAPRSADGGYMPTQPVRAIPSSGPGSTIGDRQASVDLQQAAPMAAGGDPAAMAPQGPPPPGPSAADPFGPSRRPNEPVTAGAMLGAGAQPNPQLNLRDWLAEQYREFQTSAFLDMLEELDEELGFA